MCWQQNRKWKLFVKTTADKITGSTGPFKMLAWRFFFLFRCGCSVTKFAVLAWRSLRAEALWAQLSSVQSVVAGP